MNPRYSDAIWPDPATACGVRLVPLCLGHVLLLQRLRSPFAGGDAGPGGAGIGHLVQAVYVCSRSWRRAVRGINRWSYGPWARWRAFRSWQGESLHAEAFAEYITRAWEAPKTWRGGNVSGAPRGTDVVQLLIVTQRTRWGLSMGKALDVPVAVAILDHLEALEASGTLRVWGSRDDALVAKLEEIEARDRAKPEPEGLPEGLEDALLHG